MKPFRLYQVTFPNVTLAPCLWRCWLPPGQPPLVPQPLQFSQPPSPAGTLPGDEQRAVLQGGMPSSANVFLGVVPHWATVTSSFILTPMTVFRGVLDVVGLLAHPLSVGPLGSSPHGRGDFSLRPAQRSGPSDPYCPIDMFPEPPLPPPSPCHPSASSQCTSSKHPVSCIEPGLEIHFLYDIIHVSVSFSQIIPASLSHRVQETVLYICASELISLELTDLISLLSKRLSRVFSSTTS